MKTPKFVEDIDITSNDISLLSQLAIDTWLPKKMLMRRKFQIGSKQSGIITTHWLKAMFGS